MMGRERKGAGEDVLPEETFEGPACHAAIGGGALELGDDEEAARGDMWWRWWVGHCFFGI